MKQFLLFMLCVTTFSATLMAQISLQSTDYQVSTTARDSQIVKPLKITGMALPTGGNNQTWDYSTFRDSIPNTYYYGGITSPVATTRPSVFATAGLQMPYSVNFQAFSIPNIQYYRLDATGYQYLGDSLLFTRFSVAAITGSAADSMTFPAQNRVANNNFWYRFPVTANSVWKSSYKSTINFQLKVSLLGLNNTPGQSISTITEVDTVIGWGTLRLRHPSTGAVLNFNTLLVSETYATTDSFFLGGAPAPAQVLGAFGLTQGTTTTSRRYYFLGAPFKASYLSITLADNSTTKISSAFRAILPSLGLTTAIKGFSPVEVNTTVFPNPTTEGVTFEFNKQTTADWRVFVYNETGQIINNQWIKAPIGTTQHQTSFDKSLPNGTYFYQIIDDNSLIRNTGKIALLR